MTKKEELVLKIKVMEQLLGKNKTEEDKEIIKTLYTEIKDLIFINNNQIKKQKIKDMERESFKY
ncbi:hypothetical protein [Clostridium niameyense]|uniref:hypothetical protein n=1 Tax=Clostridium niameyense TaxID=1622073 RepID=UPI0013D3F9E2|nr:hypothetical protein [Clostridium niameyense]